MTTIDSLGIASERGWAWLTLLLPQRPLRTPEACAAPGDMARALDQAERRRLFAIAGSFVELSRL